ncbi:hypothetical protein SAMN04487967_1689 [Natronorubrum sediminis]|uniref:Uncharacterized protein n=1 Tax=Natronorubrum sediminis TaxID=640943 RepID=A0A1H6FWE1_9EURY|nr:hypothetical protein SAMN04487967_1689 [Natronorubrum sediminis]
MYTVSFSENRTAGLTSVDCDAAKFQFGKFTPKLTARGPNPVRWFLPHQSVRDRLPYYPPASGHGHQP